MKTFFELFIVFLIALGILFVFDHFGQGDTLPSKKGDMREDVCRNSRDKVKPCPVPFTYMAVGDVMLGRNVRNLMRAHGDEYPFAFTAPLFENADAVVINLEGPITSLDAPDERVGPDQPYSMRFAFDVSSADALARAGVTHASLANNHAWDQGVQGNEDTKQQLERVGILYFDEEQNATTSSPHNIVFVGLDDTIAPVDIDAVTQTLASFDSGAHVVVFIHWGDEYELVHKARQEQLAHALVDAGVDAIIGGHPHVVQDIEVYNGAPIFYSLGNFIFDQYWERSVETGLALRITHSTDGVRYELIPIDGNHSQPKLMEGVERQAVLDALAERSQPDLESMIRDGALWLE